MINPYEKDNWRKLTPQQEWISDKINNVTTLIQPTIYYHLDIDKRNQHNKLLYLLDAILFRVLQPFIDLIHFGECADW